MANDKYVALLKADEADDGPAWSDERVAEAFHAGVATVERLRQRFVEEGLQAALRLSHKGHYGNGSDQQKPCWWASGPKRPRFERITPAGRSLA